MKRKLFGIALTIVCLCALVLGLTACESGKSAYELYVKEYVEINGSKDGVLTESEWLSYLKGEEGEAGKSAYELYVKEYIEINGSEDGVLTESEWLSFLKGEEGEAGKSAYELYVKEYIEINGSEDGVLTESEWLSFLKGEEGEAGKSAYELYVREYVEINGSEEGVMTESEWLSFLKGEEGEAGKSAYELYVKEYVEINGSEEGVMTESEWLSFLKGEEGEAGKSAYELYVKEYVEINGSKDGVLTESEWLGYLKGDTGVGIKEIHIVCGDIIIHYDNDNTVVLEAVYPEAGHQWNSGEITSKATCISLGVITFTCEECGAAKKELLEETGEHRWGNYSHNDDTHWRTCKICGEEEIFEHDFGDNISKDDVDAILECECGINQTVGEFFAYKVTFECNQGASIIIYETQDYSLNGVASNIAYSRSGDTGELLNNGDGQVNFFVNILEDYILDEIIITPTFGYKNFKKDTEVDNTYRITKINQNLIVTVSTKPIASLENLGSLTDENGVISFTWDSNEDIKYVIATVSSQDKVVEYRISETSSWQYNLVENNYYKFKFTPYMDNDILGKSFECTRYYSSEIKTVSFPRIDITTQNYIFPSCDYVSAPEGCWGAGTTNKNYVQCILNLYNSNNELIYQSNNNLTETDAYTGAKLKVRGNTSAYSEKKPYKVKLNKKYDLLSSLIPNRTDKSYADKEWLLLNSGTSLNQLTGWSVSSTLQMDYTPAYTYIELYLNGDYRGLYILCESVGQGNGFDEEQARCAVSDSGFIVEMDAYWWNEDLYFSTPFTQGKPPQYTFKHPDSDEINVESSEYLYIKEYISNFEKALFEDNDSYLQYIDEESFAKWLLSHDILGTFDSAGSNIYLTKFDNTEQSVLKMGPLWDFDTILKCGINNYSRIRSGNHFYYPSLIKRSSFIEKYAEIFNRVKDEIIADLTKNIEIIDSEAYNTLINHEQLRWKASFNTIEVQQSNLIEWFEQHLAWMENEII